MAARRLPKTLTPEEVEALLAVPNLRAPTGVRNRAMLVLMHRTGLRVAEVCGVQLRDWRRRDHQVELRADVAKGGREAVVYLDVEARSALEMWRAIRPRRAARLFTTLAGGPVSTDYVRQMVKRYARRAGIERRVHPHMLRHTFATELLRSGEFNVREVQRLMRHADIRTTAVYLEVFDADLQRKIQARSGPASAASK
jgi:integrase/recombinase XerD